MPKVHGFRINYESVKTRGPTVWKKKNMWEIKSI